MRTEQTSLILLSGIGRVFRTEELDTHALSDVELAIERGDFVSIEGPSGCGKSTLLAILGLLDAPTSGSYRLDGHAVEALSAAERARIRREQIGFIFQGFNLIGELSVYENIELPLTYVGLPKAERRDRVEAALDRVEMTHRRKHLPSQLSGGQQQRVAVARAVVTKPLIVLADEPTGNLDSKNGEQVMALLADLHKEGATLCMVTHDPRYASCADKRVQLFDGRIVEDRRRSDAIAV